MKLKLSDDCERKLIKGIDFFFKIWPQPFPGRERLKACKIVSHRGEHDNRRVFENTLQAFEQAHAQGIWGIEFDIRWTRDVHPVVIHDPDLDRVFGLNLKVRELTRKELKSRCPQVPSLSEVIAKFGRKLHFMVEIKTETYPDPILQNEILGDLFAPLAPQRDYHVMSLDPAMLDLIAFVPAGTMIPIAMLNPAEISKLALKKAYCGVAGHYLLLNDATLARHHENGQHVGTGYPASQNCLFREINRGVEWIFSNNAGALQEIVNRITQSGAANRI